MKDLRRESTERVHPVVPVLTGAQGGTRVVFGALAVRGVYRKLPLGPWSGHNTDPGAGRCGFRL